MLKQENMLNIPAGSLTSPRGQAVTQGQAGISGEAAERWERCELLILLSSMDHQPVGIKISRLIYPSR